MLQLLTKPGHRKVNGEIKGGLKRPTLKLLNWCRNTLRVLGLVDKLVDASSRRSYANNLYLYLLFLQFFLLFFFKLLSGQRS